MSQLLAKIIYIRHSISPLEFIATRETVACCLWILTVNVKLKHFMWDSILPHQFKGLLIRSTFGTFNGYFGIQNIKFFTLVYCGISTNAAPLVTCLFSYIFLKEAMKGIDKILIIIVVIGVTIMSMDKFIGPSHRDAHHNTIIPWYGYFGLFYVPVGLASSNVLMRKMKGLHFITIATYKYVIMMPLLVLIFVVFGFDWETIENFELLDWFLIVLAAICQQSSQTFRFLAFKREKPAHIVHFQYLNSFYALLFDLFIFHANFHIFSIIGLTIMLSGYFIKFVYSVHSVNQIK